MRSRRVRIALADTDDDQDAESGAGDPRSGEAVAAERDGDARCVSTQATAIETHAQTRASRTIALTMPKARAMYGGPPCVVEEQVERCPDRRDRHHRSGESPRADEGERTEQRDPEGDQTHRQADRVRVHEADRDRHLDQERRR